MKLTPFQSQLLADAAFESTNFSGGKIASFIYSWSVKLDRALSRLRNKTDKKVEEFTQKTIERFAEGVTELPTDDEQVVAIQLLDVQVESLCKAKDMLETAARLRGISLEAVLEVFERQGNETQQEMVHRCLKLERYQQFSNRLKVAWNQAHPNDKWSLEP